MQTVVGVRFKKAGKIYYFDPAGLELSPGQAVVVETARGSEYGEVVVGPKQVPEDEIVPPLKRVMRIAGPEDEVQVKENVGRAQRAFDVCLQKIAAHGLPMKLVDVEYAFDGSKITFFFTAEGRVDFRELVRDLAAAFRTRIELRQIGVRDEAKMIGGLGPCGRPLCCTTFLGDFEPVSIKMAKEQNLSLNPTKISGICGRLMCCLKFEAESYKASGEERACGGRAAEPEATPAVGGWEGAASPGGGREPAQTVPGQAHAQAVTEVSAAAVAAPPPAEGAGARQPAVGRPEEAAGPESAMGQPQRRRRRPRRRRRHSQGPGAPQPVQREQPPGQRGSQGEAARTGRPLSQSPRRRRRAAVAALRRLDGGGPKDGD